MAHAQLNTCELDGKAVFRSSAEEDRPCCVALRGSGSSPWQWPQACGHLSLLRYRSNNLLNLALGNLMYFCWARRPLTGGPFSFGGDLYGVQMPRKPTAAVYARVSTQDQKTDMQFTELRQYAERMGWNLVEYAEKASSVKKRPVLEKLLADAQLRKFDIVLV